MHLHIYILITGRKKKKKSLGEEKGRKRKLAKINQRIT